ncbi:MAG: hypothetical protein ACR2O3_06545 [Rhizobiaceae bacterium]
MASRREIWKAAQNMIDRYGDAALQQADLRIEELCQLDEKEAVRLWHEIRLAIKEILNKPTSDNGH